MSYCIHCGKHYKQATPFCIGCGKPLPQPPAPEQPVTERPEVDKGSPKTWLFILCGIAVIFCVVYFFWNDDEGTGNTIAKKKKKQIPEETTYWPERNRVKDYVTEGYSADSVSLKVVEAPPPMDIAVPPDPDYKHEPLGAGSSYINSDNKLIYQSECYVIITNKFKTLKEAQQACNSAYSHRLGYFWMPDYLSFKQEKFYATFIGPYETYSRVEINLRDLPKTGSTWYGVRLSKSDPARVEIKQ